VQKAAADGPLLQAQLLKFIKDGKGSHKKHFVLYPSAMIEWREDPKDANAHREQVISVSTGITELKKHKLTAQEQALVFTIQTTGTYGRCGALLPPALWLTRRSSLCPPRVCLPSAGKTLHLMGSTKDERDRWVSTVDGILNKRSARGSVAGPPPPPPAAAAAKR
jgi:hypothetical protein